MPEARTQHRTEEEGPRAGSSYLPDVLKEVKSCSLDPSRKCRRILRASIGSRVSNILRLSAHTSRAGPCRGRGRPECSQAASTLETTSLTRSPASGAQTAHPARDLSSSHSSTWRGSPRSSGSSSTQGRAAAVLNKGVPRGHRGKIPNTVSGENVGCGDTWHAVPRTLKGREAIHIG